MYLLSSVDTLYQDSSYFLNEQQKSGFYLGLQNIKSNGPCSARLLMNRFDANPLRIFRRHQR